MNHTSLVPVHKPDRSKPLLGFWLYLMSDVILFGALFATYAVLKDNTYGGPGGSELFDLPFVLLETVLLLTSSYTIGLTALALRLKNIRLTITGLIATFLLGLGFLGMEIYEFTKLISEGHGWWASGFLSAFFTLVGTHGLHILVGLIWIAVMIWLVLRRPERDSTMHRMTLLSMFWHFLDVIWIFIFSVVYLMGVL